jgi:hypothetical protein
MARKGPADYAAQKSASKALKRLVKFGLILGNLIFLKEQSFPSLPNALHNTPCMQCIRIYFFSRHQYLYVPPARDCARHPNPGPLSFGLVPRDCT